MEAPPQVPAVAAWRHHHLDCHVRTVTIVITGEGITFLVAFLLDRFFMIAIQILAVMDLPPILTQAIALALALYHIHTHKLTYKRQRLLYLRRRLSNTQNH